MNKSYNLAMSEVICIINQSNDKYKKKIPKSFMKFLNENADKSYNPEFDVNIPLKDLPLKKEAKAILALIYRSYICTKEERIEYDKLLKENDKKMQEILNEKYDVYKVFEERQKNTIENEIVDNELKEIAECRKESIFIRIINKIKQLFKRNTN